VGCLHRVGHTGGRSYPGKAGGQRLIRQPADHTLAVSAWFLSLPSLKVGIEWDFNFGVAARNRRIDSRDNSVHMTAQDGPLGISKKDESDFSARQILLIPDVLVSRYDSSKPEASAASSITPFTSLSHPRSIASTTTWPLRPSFHR